MKFRFWPVALTELGGPRLREGRRGEALALAHRGLRSGGEIPYVATAFVGTAVEAGACDEARRAWGRALAVLREGAAGDGGGDIIEVMRARLERCQADAAAAARSTPRTRPAPTGGD